MNYPIAPRSATMASQGRGGDSMLVHMAPQEVAGLHALAMAKDGQGLTINPQTGLPEAFKLKDLLPAIAGFALGPAGFGLMSAGTAALTVGGISALTSGSLEKGIMAGLGAYGGANLGEGLASMGTGAISEAAGAGLGEEAAQQAVASKLAAASPWDKISAGAQAAISNPSKFVDTMGGGMKTLQNAYMAASPILADQAVQTKTPGPGTMQTPGYIRPYYGYDPETGRMTAGTPIRADAIRMADGGEVEDAQQKILRGLSPQQQQLLTPQVQSTGVGAQGLTGASKNAMDYLLGKTQASRPAPTVAKPALGPDTLNVGDKVYTLDPATGRYKLSSAPAAPATPAAGGIAGLPQEGSTPAVGGQAPGTSSTPNGMSPGFNIPTLPGVLGALVPGGMLGNAVNAATAFGNQSLAAQQSGAGVLSLLSPEGRASAASIVDNSPLANEAMGPTATTGAGGTGGNAAAAAAAAANTVGQMGFGDAITGLASQTAANAVIGGASQESAVAAGVSAASQAAADQGIAGPIGMAGDVESVPTGIGAGSVGAPAGDIGGANGDISGLGIGDVGGGAPSGGAPAGDIGGANGDIGGLSVGDVGDASGDASGDFRNGGIVALAKGGMRSNAFVVPADVVSAMGNGSTKAGLAALNQQLRQYAGGGATPIQGPGDGLSDSIPTMIDGKRRARVADGEAYINPETVARLGGGDVNRGTKKLYRMMDKIRQQAHGKTTQQRPVKADRVLAG